MGKQRQVLYPDYQDRKCKYCEGRGFFITSSLPSAIKDISSNVIIECKFCSGTGNNAPFQTDLSKSRSSCT